MKLTWSSAQMINKTFKNHIDINFNIFVFKKYMHTNLPINCKFWVSADNEEDTKHYEDQI